MGERGEVGGGVVLGGMNESGVVEDDDAADGVMVEDVGGGTAPLRMLSVMLFVTDVGSTICDVWCRKRALARMGSRKVGGRRVMGVLSSRTERRRDLLMIEDGFEVTELGESELVGCGVNAPRSLSTCRSFLSRPYGRLETKLTGASGLRSWSEKLWVSFRKALRWSVRRHMRILCLREGQKSSA